MSSFLRVIDFRPRRVALVLVEHVLIILSMVVSAVVLGVSGMPLDNAKASYMRPKIRRDGKS
jgi:hypothetical protein